MKKITSIIIIIAMLFAVVIQAGGIPAQSMQLRVVADRTTAEPGETVFFTVVLGSVSEIGSVQMEIDLPQGLTYVAGSGSIDADAKDTMGFDSLEWTESILMINGYASKGDYISSGDTVLASFSCTVDSGVSGVLSVGLTNIEMGSCQSFGILTDMFEVVAADVNVAGDTPTFAPTQAPTQASTEAPTVAPTQRAPYVWPTYTRPTTTPTQKATEAPTQAPTIAPTQAVVKRNQLRVTADKTEVNAGDTVNFTVVLGPISEVGSVQMEIDLPKGLTYVAGSGSIDADAKETMGFDILEWTEAILMINGCASKGDYISSGDTVLASFSCTVDSYASGVLSVGLTNIEMGSCQTFGVFTELFDIIMADVTVISGSPVIYPTTIPTERPTVHSHHLTRVYEVPATEESEGVKAHYVCSGEDGCGKIFEDYFGTVELTEADLIIPKLVPTTSAPTQAATRSPYVWPTYSRPTTAPTQASTVAPTQAATRSPYVWPTYSRPTTAPTQTPTVAPTQAATRSPYVWPTYSRPTTPPTQAPTSAPTQAPTTVPTQTPTQTPTNNSGNYPYNNSGNIWWQWYQNYINYFSGLPWYSNGDSDISNYGYYLLPYSLSNPFFWIYRMF